MTERERLDKMITKINGSENPLCAPRDMTFFRKVKFFYELLNLETLDLCVKLERVLKKDKDEYYYLISYRDLRPKRERSSRFDWVSTKSPFGYKTEHKCFMAAMEWIMQSESYSLALWQKSRDCEFLKKLWALSPNKEGANNG